jgi:hypothetical protein
VDTSGLWKFRNRSRKSAIPVFDLGAVGGRNAIGACSFLPSPHTNDIPVVPRQILNENLAHHPIFKNHLGRSGIDEVNVGSAS